MRIYTNKLLEMVEEGILSHKSVMKECLNFMSEDDVKLMYEQTYE